MGCTDVAELIDLYVDGELAEESRLRVERHLLRCAECSFTARGLEQTREHLRTAYLSAECSPSFRERAAARLQDELSDVVHAEPAASKGQWSLPFTAERPWSP